MALFSDVDWVILLVAAGFLLLGEKNGEFLRQLGRWYGRAGRLKQELLAEFSKAADLPVSGAGPLTIRGALLGLDPTPTQRSGIPAAVARPPVAALAPVAPIAPSWGPWTGGYPVPTWSSTVAAMTGEVEPYR